jgi:hypothetical protein
MRKPGSFNAAAPASRLGSHPWVALLGRFGNLSRHCLHCCRLAVTVAILQRPDMIVALALLTIPFGILWWVWSQIPAWFRTRIYKMLRRRGHERGGDD